MDIIERTISFIIPALNEELFLEATVIELIPIAERYCQRFEIIIIDDGSSDATPAIADRLAAADPRIKIIHHEKPCGVAVGFYEGVALASCHYVVIVPGDQAYGRWGLENLIGAVGQAEMVLSYRNNQKKSRSLLRFLLARAYVTFANLLFGIRLTDINSLALLPVSELRKIDAQATHLGFYLEILVKLIRRNITYVVVPMDLNLERHVFGRSLLNRYVIKDVFRVYMHLLSVRLRGEKQRSE
jgi:glycosyltransferase involved in cell wall biosynthesis